MKLQNKKTGQLGNFIINKDHFECVDLDYVPEYRNLAELTEEWEDYEEPKEYWYIDYDGGILCGESDNTSAEKMMISMGNHFESLEKAEKAVEKLKAWKRLRDKGFKFNGCNSPSDNGMCICYETDIENWSMQDLQDFKVLFGGEE